ncbi:unnamed protein product [Coregonus sp. 'balchen']|nr:unnamed protein product [Coregonus sp. 'balchen']
MEFSGCPAAAGVAVGDEAQEAEKEGHAHVLFDEFVQASTCRATLRAFNLLCEHLQLTHTHTQPQTYSPTQPQRPFYHTLKERLSYWKANALCPLSQCVIIGAGPCGLRTAVELGFLGARVVLLEKRDAFSRNNVLHLWPFTIHDLRGLGAKKFYGKFCAGAIDHIKVGWRVEVKPKSHPINQLQCDVVIGADGRRNTLPGFRRKEFRGKLAIAITANFMNRNTTAEAKVEEISGVAFIFNQRFFQELRDATGVDLENIVYYKDDTHYFDYADTETLLSRGNVDQNALLAYAREAADFSTNHQLPSLDFAMNHYGQPDVALFDFTCMYASENAALVRQRHGHHLLVTLVGDSLLELLRQGESDPLSTERYINITLTIGLISIFTHIFFFLSGSPESFSRFSKLLSWCQQQTQGYRGVAVSDLTTSWKSGLALCALIHHYRPDLMLGLEVAEKEFGISPVMTVEEMSSVSETDTLCMVMYLSQFHQLFKDALPPSESQTESLDGRAAEEAALCSVGGASQSRVRSMANQLLAKFEENAPCPSSTPAAALRRQGDSMPTLPHPPASPDPQAQPAPMASATTWKQKKRTQQQEQMSFKYKEKVKCHTLPSRGEQKYVQMYTGGVSSLAEQISNQVQSQESSSPQHTPNRKESAGVRSVLAGAGPGPGGASDVCFFCSKRVYVMERLSAEGLFFHRSCFQCDHCSSTLRLASYAYDRPNGEPLRVRDESEKGESPGGCRDQIECVFLLFCRPALFSMEESHWKFYCKPHYDLRLVGPVQRKRPAPPTADQPPTPYGRTPSQRTLLESPAALSTNPRSSVAVVTADRRSSVASLIERECGLAKRVRGTPERIELENYRVSLETEQLTDEPEEVPEEMLANYNLSLLVTEEKKANYKRSPDSWRKAMELHAHLRGERGEEEEETEEGEEEGEVDEDDDEEEELSSDDTHSPDTHSPDTHSPDTLMPDIHTPDIQLPDSTTPDTNGPQSPTSLRACWDSLPCPSVEAESLQSPAPRPAPRFAPAPIMASAVVRGVGGKKLKPWDVGGGRRSIAGGSVGGGSVGAGSLGEQLYKDEGIDPLEDISPPLSPLKPLKAVPRDEREMERRREIERAAMGVGWEDTKIPLGREPLPGKSRDGLDPRRLTESLPPLLLTQLQGGSLFPPHKSRRDNQPPSQSVPEAGIGEGGPLGLWRASAYVPHALAFKRAYAIKRKPSCPTEVVGVLVHMKDLKDPSSLDVSEAMFHRDRDPEEEQLDARLTRRVQRAARKQAKQEQLKRLHRAQRQLEERGVAVEKALRGEAVMGRQDDPALMQQWFKLVQQKNCLMRYESELMIFARELELEDRQSRLQQELRERMAVDDHLKGEAELAEEKLILGEMLEVVEQRDALVSLLEEQRLQESQEDRDLEAIMLSRGLGLHNWA